MMRDFIKSISKYFVQIKESGRLMKALSYSTILTMIIMCLDLTNKPSELIEDIPRQMCITLIIGVGILILLFAFNKRLLQSFKMVTSNYIDSISIISLITSTVCTTIWALTEKTPYKILLGLIIFIFSIVSLLIRLFIVRSAYIRLDNMASYNVIYDLKSIYDNEFTVKEGMPILISEKDVDYDLLGRKIIINQLYKYISNYKADASYVIGLIGDWGSGKTTILNNVKRELKKNRQVVLIDDFDPWIYGTQEALLTDMFDKIMDKTGVSFNLSKSRSFVETLKAITTNTASDLKIVDKVVDKLITTDKEDVSFLINEMQTYLTLNNKTVVFFIDNIDRAESDNIIFMFKLIGTVFNLPNIIYVLSYDKNRVDDILKNTQKINPKYTEKIINQEIYVPRIQSERLYELYYVSITNILRQYGVKENELSNYSSIIVYIAETVPDLRSFKRLINSVFANVFLNPCKLDRTVMIIIETIRFLDFELYESISTNRQYYISSDYSYNVALFTQHMSKEAFYKAEKEYFDTIFNSHSSSQEILSTIFPYVQMHKNNISIYDYGNYRNDNIMKQDAPIYSLKFFDLYFSYGSNEFLEELDSINTLIMNLNTTTNNQEIDNALNSTIYSSPIETHKEKLEVLQLKIDEISLDAIYNVMVSLWNNLDSIDNTHQFFNLSPKERAMIIISTLLNRINEDELNRFILSIKNDFGRIADVRHIIYWLNSSKHGASDAVKDKFEKLYSELCSRTIDEKVDLYSDKYYRQYNITGGLFAFYNESEDKDLILSDYIKNIYRDEYVYKALADVLSTSVGSHGYSYSLLNDCFDIIYIDEGTIKKSIEKYPPKSESEKRISEIFEKYQNKATDPYDRHGICSPVPISFIL